MNKRGFEIELGWEFLFSMLLLVAFLIIIVVWINSQSSGDLIKKQILAKEICLITAEAKPNTLISVEAGGLEIENKDSGILVKKGIQKYFYPCYANNAEFSRIDDKIIIKIK